MPQPDEYDYGDPEFWENLGNSDDASLAAATCFPEFWQHSFSWPNPKELARVYRDYYWQAPTIDEFASDPFISAHGLLKLPDHSTPPRPPLDDDLWQRAVKRATKDVAPDGSPSRSPSHPSTRKRVLLPDGAIYVSGHRLATQKLLLPFSQQVGDKGVQWGPVRLPAHAHKGHYCIVGMTRAGKTAIIRLLAASLKKHRRFVVYDDKTDLVPFFSPEPGTPAHPLYILNPFDRRSIAWDIAKDATTPSRADEIAEILIPAEPDENPYFVDTPRALMAATINALNRRVPGKWSFLDLLIALEHIQTVLQHDEPSRRVFNQHLAAANQTAANLISSLANKIRPFKTAAAAWSHATERLSITEWAHSKSGTLVLGNHSSYEVAMRNINRVLFHLLAQALIHPAVRSKKKLRTYIILDELQQLSFLDKLNQLLIQGAGFGLNLVLGIQDVQALRRHYGEEADGLIGQCNHYAFLRIQTTLTAEWASAILGSQQIIRHQEATGSVGDQQTQTTSFTHVQRPIVPVSDLQQLPLTTDTSGLTAFFKSICHPTYRGHIPAELVFLGSPYKTKDDIPASAWKKADIAVGSYPTLESPAVSGLSAFEGRTEDELLFPEQHAPYLERLGFTQGVPSMSAQAIPGTFQATSHEFDPDRFPRLRIRPTG